MSEGLSESRFNMWRAVVAMAHADGVVVPEEKTFIEGYMNSLPFSEDQKALLYSDLETPQDAYEMFDKITEKSDQAEFFQFARMIIWCDGDLATQEDQIFAHLKKSQIQDIGMETMQQLAQETRDLEKIRRMRDDEIFEQKAQDSLNLRNILKTMIGD